MKRRQLIHALPLGALAGLLGSRPLAGHADPMRPLVLPPAASAAAASPQAAGGERAGARPRESEAPREPERLVAIRQDGPDSAQRWLALFGERWVRTGDRLERYTVAAIDGNSVQLTDGKQRKTVHLLPPLLRPGPPPAQPLAGATPPRAADRSTDVAQAPAWALPTQRAHGSSTP